MRWVRIHGHLGTLLQSTTFFCRMTSPQPNGYFNSWTLSNIPAGQSVS
ncbi:MAG: hypothetical protein H0A76_10035 [Candidatus Thiodubiliella endoseptemdiera]|uniref:Uncharacterized protein n=1 Tax=Candidatus Thiodubiliella endoseptemdiera TaxID=2738886 RepID=A0A853F3V0_9GAMM|nr:hypothetical protein [Candidatus Thiodubiliella endoseptemdiera]